MIAELEKITKNVTLADECASEAQSAKLSIARLREHLDNYLDNDLSEQREEIRQWIMRELSECNKHYCEAYEILLTMEAQGFNTMGLRDLLEFVDEAHFSLSREADEIIINRTNVRNS